MKRDKNPLDEENSMIHPNGSALPRPLSSDPPTSDFNVDIAGLSQTGQLRTNNEDHYLVFRFERSLKTMMTNLMNWALPNNFDEVGYGLLVADGIGGHLAGEVASRLALIKLVELLVETPDWVMKVSENENAETVLHRITERFRQIDSEIREQAKSDPLLLGMGTTLTVAASIGAELFVGHIGDSRAYLLRNQRIHQLTRDNTFAQELINAGIVEPDDTAALAMRHVLTAALATGDQTDPQVQRFRLSDGDQVLLCTDGLTRMVKDETIGKTLRDSNSAAAACQKLFDLALAAGGTDDITVVVARYQIPVSQDAVRTARPHSL